MKTKKIKKNKNSNDEDVLKWFDQTFDDFNDKKITKEIMLKNCKELHSKLSSKFLKNKHQ